MATLSDLLAGRKPKIRRCNEDPFRVLGPRPKVQDVFRGALTLIWKGELDP